MECRHIGLEGSDLEGKGGAFSGCSILSQLGVSHNHLLESQLDGWRLQEEKKVQA